MMSIDEVVFTIEVAFQSSSYSSGEFHKGAPVGIVQFSGEAYLTELACMKREFLDVSDPSELGECIPTLEV